MHEETEPNQRWTAVPPLRHRQSTRVLCRVGSHCVTGAPGCSICGAVLVDLNGAISCSVLAEHLVESRFVLVIVLCDIDYKWLATEEREVRSTSSR